MFTLVLFRRRLLSSVEWDGRLGRAFEKRRQKKAALGRTRATWRRTLGIPSHPAEAFRCGAVRTAWNQAVDDAASVGPDSRSLLGNLLEKYLPLLPGEELDKPQTRLQENTTTVEPSALYGPIFARVKKIKF